MAGDLEDFLKRAAARRQAKVEQEEAQRNETKRSSSRSRPEYTDSRRERETREVDDVPLTAELVEAEDPLAQQRRRVAEAKRRAAEAKQKSESRSKSKGHSDSAGRKEKSPQRSPSDPPPAIHLLELLRSPDGIRTAFLLREILERPEDRW